MVFSVSHLVTFANMSIINNISPKQIIGCFLYIGRNRILRKEVKMNSIFEEISILRKGAPLIIDNKNSNRYRIVVVEPDGTKTAYYFAAPIYNFRTKKAVDMKFNLKGDVAYATGSNSNITISNNILMENSEGSCVISLSDRISHISEKEVLCRNERICLTTNGVSIRRNCVEGKPFTFTIEISKPFLEVRANDKCFALMSERFRPFIAISCIGTTDSNGNIISPASISYQKTFDRKYTFTVSPCSSLGKSVVIEANLYESKLFQDTTVESKNAKANNAFGSVGFIGTTKEFGEQWLYSRPDYSKMHELNDKKIQRAILHIPKLNNVAVELSASKVATRFCSFGSTWDNKVAEASSLTDSQITDHYFDLNLMPFLTDKQGRLSRGEGFILKSKKKGIGFSVIATGDNCFAPQILEINYR